MHGVSGRPMTSKRPMQAGMQARGPCNDVPLCYGGGGLALTDGGRGIRRLAAFGGLQVETGMRGSAGDLG